MINKFFLKNWISILFTFLYFIVIGINFNEIGFSNDELSALYRTQFKNFEDLIQFGVKKDGHPAGVQVFLYYYTKIFGFSHFIIKLPFILAGWVSILVSIHILLRKKNQLGAIFISLSLIFSEFMIAHFTTARPYSIGLLLNLLLFIKLYNILISKNKLNSYLLASFYFVLSFYTHYFSFLQSIIISILFLIFYYNRFNFKYILISISIILILTMPHFQLTLFQLKMEGLSWLTKPKWDNIFDFWQYYFNDFKILYYLVLGLLLFSCYSFFKKFNKFNLILLLMFFVPYFILYIYSHLRAPVLQYPALIFSFPSLLIFIASVFKINLNKRNKHAVLILFFITILFSFVFYQNYFEKKKHNPYWSFINQKNYYPTVWAGRDQYLKFYANIYNKNLSNFVFNPKSIENLPDTFISNQLNIEMLFKLKENYIFFKSTENHTLFTKYYWAKEKLKIKTDYKPFYNLEIDDYNEWSNYFELPKFQNYLNFKFECDTNAKNIEFITEIYSGENKYVRSIDLGENQTLYIKINDILSQKEILKDGFVIKFFLKNNYNIKHKFKTNVILKTMENNPLEYERILKY